MQLERPLTQKEKAVVLGVHPSTISAFARLGLPRRANARETIDWYRRHPSVRVRDVYRR